MNRNKTFLSLLVAMVFIASCSFNKETQRTGSVSIISVPTEQVAIVQYGNGGADVLRYDSIPVTDPGQGEVLIRIVATAINPIERRNREGAGTAVATNTDAAMGGGGTMGMGGPGGGGMGAGSMAGSMGGSGGGTGGNMAGGGTMGGANAVADVDESELSVPGSDVSGIVVKVGEGVTNLREGDKVFAKLDIEDDMNGGYSQFAIADANQTLIKPSDHTFSEAAGLATVGMTAIRALDHADVQAGQRVFINGIGGGVGSSAAQIALARGAYVLGTASQKHHAYLKSIGVSEVINYQEVQFDEVIEEPVDVVIETVSSETADQALNILKSGGKLVSIAGPANVTRCENMGVSCSRIGGNDGRANDELLREIQELADDDKYKLNVDTTYPLEEAGAAQDHNFEIGTTGKIVLIVDPELADKK